MLASTQGGRTEPTFSKLTDSGLGANIPAMKPLIVALLTSTLAVADTNTVSTDKTPDSVMAGVKRNQISEQRRIVLGVIAQKIEGGLLIQSGKGARGENIRPKVVKARIQQEDSLVLLYDHPSYETLAIGGYVEVVAFPMGRKFFKPKSSTQESDQYSRQANVWTISLDKAAAFAANRDLPK